MIDSVFVSVGKSVPSRYVFLLSFCTGDMIVEVSDPSWLILKVSLLNLAQVSESVFLFSFMRKVSFKCSLTLYILLCGLFLGIAGLHLIMSTMLYLN